MQLVHTWHKNTGNPLVFSRLDIANITGAHMG